ncbi:hypothetical protein NP493_218g02004 [Ridgeia piscesae]|uniref:Uncharacterized protein n=1 Tax=Ridgeia piscesae TaxID=27915 RepID=A0AAD9P0M3_RIDPI|nr:hypothetical protein NP493_218g02004 [Ridgeia piscesae]
MDIWLAEPVAESVLECLRSPKARGYREFGDCAVFFDHNRNTCEDVTSPTNALDFILRVGPLSSQSTFGINVTLQEGTCADDKQLHVYTVTELSGGPFDGSFRRCHVTTTEPLGGATVCSFTCRCTDTPCLYVTARIFGNFGPVKSLCEIEID